MYIHINKAVMEMANRVTQHFWQPNATVIRMIERLCITKGSNRVLEIGPGVVPFSLATHFVGCNESIEKEYVDIDIDKDVLPYEDGYFDFIYCRHVLEDIQNPDFVLREIFRVCKGGGYIETPSPLIEITKGVDASAYTNLYCGYIHHRYIVWSSIEKNEIYLLPKYSCILDHLLSLEKGEEPNLYEYINCFPVYWNNYFVFSRDALPKVIMYKNGVSFNTKNGNMITEYLEIVRRALRESIDNTIYFVNKHRDLLIS